MRNFNVNYVSCLVISGLLCCVISKVSAQDDDPADRIPKIIDNGGIDPTLQDTDSSDTSLLNLAETVQNALLPGPVIVPAVEDGKDSVNPNELSSVEKLVAQSPQSVKDTVQTTFDDNVADEATLDETDGNVAETKTDQTPSTDVKDEILGQTKDIETDGSEILGQTKDIKTDGSETLGQTKDIEIDGPEILGQTKDIKTDGTEILGQTKDIETDGPDILGQTKDIETDAPVDKLVASGVSMMKDDDKKSNIETGVKNITNDVDKLTSVTNGAAKLDDVEILPVGVDSSTDEGYVNIDGKETGLMTGNEDWSKLDADQNVLDTQEDGSDDNSEELVAVVKHTMPAIENIFETTVATKVKEGGSNMDENSVFSTTESTATSASSTSLSTSWWLDENANTDSSTETVDSDFEGNNNDQDQGHEDDIDYDDDDDYNDDDDDIDYDEDDYNYDDDDIDYDEDDDMDYEDDDYSEDDDDDEGIWADSKSDYANIFEGDEDDYLYDDDSTSDEDDRLWNVIENNPWWKESEDNDEWMTTTESWETTAYYDNENDDKEWDAETHKVDAGKSMMESPHHFDNNAGVFGGARVADESSPVDKSERSLYSWTMLLSLCFVVGLFFVFWNRHKFEKYVISFRRPSVNNLYVRRGDEEKNLLQYEYA